jgi:hypothetical protein
MPERGTIAGEKGAFQQQQRGIGGRIEHRGAAMACATWTALCAGSALVLATRLTTGSLTNLCCQSGGMLRASRRCMWFTEWHTARHRHIPRPSSSQISAWPHAWPSFRIIGGSDETMQVGGLRGNDQAGQSAAPDLRR